MDEPFGKKREPVVVGLELHNQEMQRANRHKSEVLANMSHELRTPLHTVIGFSALLSEETKGPLNEHQKWFVDHIHEDSQHLLTLINKILDLSKSRQTGIPHLSMEALDIGAVLDDTVSSILPRGLEKPSEIDAGVAGRYWFRRPRASDADSLQPV